jgi:hypothetical protein
MSNIFDKLTADTNIEQKVAAVTVTADKPVKDSSIEPAVYTPDKVKAVTQELLKYGFVEADRKPNLYKTALIEQQRINDILEPLDLTLKIDDIRGLAFLVVADHFISNENNNGNDEWTHPLIRRQRLTTEQSLLLAILRQYYVVYEKEAGVGAGNAMVALDDLLSQLKLYLGESGSDVKDEKRLRNLLDQLKSHGIVSEIDKKDQITIRPLITHLANPHTLKNLLAHFKQLADGDKPQEP